jgi:class 3 adenylate cyclase
MSKKVFEKTSNKPINKKLDNLETIKAEAIKLKSKEASIIKQIRDGFVDCAVVFIDLVESTKFKIEKQEDPEDWILRVKQFGDIVKEYIENSDGRVVKYIGDEVMGIFDQPTKIDDALSLIIRISNIESYLSEITGFPTKIKIALDYGKVFMLKYEGHNELDPQGTPIDRCARIGKYCIPSSILSSYEFVSKCRFTNQWNNIGHVEMKGLGLQSIYQYGEETFSVKKRIEIDEESLISLKEEINYQKEAIQKLTLEKKNLISSVQSLQVQIEKNGYKPVIDTDFENETEMEEKVLELNKILEKIEQIKKLIYDSGISMREYGRFLFLNQKGFPEEYNSFKGRTFDASIEKNLVKEDSDDRYVLNTENKRNQMVTDLIDKTERLLIRFVSKYGPIDQKDLFEYSFSDADFWSSYLDINVT